MPATGGLEGKWYPLLTAERRVGKDNSIPTLRSLSTGQQESTPHLMNGNPFKKEGRNGQSDSTRARSDESRKNPERATLQHRAQVSRQEERAISASRADNLRSYRRRQESPNSPTPQIGQFALYGDDYRWRNEMYETVRYSSSDLRSSLLGSFRVRHLKMAIPECQSGIPRNEAQ